MYVLYQFRLNVLPLLLNESIVSCLKDNSEEANDVISECSVKLRHRNFGPRCTITIHHYPMIHFIWTDDIKSGHRI